MIVQNINHLYNVLLSCLDMKIQNITVCDQTTKLPIEFNERRLKYNANGFTLVHRGEVEFNPICNFRQTQQLFSIALQFASEDDGLYVQIFYDRKAPDGVHSVLEMKTNTGLIVSSEYYNTNLCYIEIILRLSGIVVDNLSMFDSEPPVEDEEPKRKRVPRFPVRDLL